MREMYERNENQLLMLRIQTLDFRHTTYVETRASHFFTSLKFRGGCMKFLSEFLKSNLGPKTSNILLSGHCGAQHVTHDQGQGSKVTVTW